MFLIAAIIGAAFAFAIGILIGHFAIAKEATDVSRLYEKLTRKADQQNYRTFIDSVQAANIETNLK